MRAAVIACLIALMPLPASAADPDFDSATGFRIARYRSPVPGSIEGAKRITAADVTDLVRERKAILVDVMPSEGAGPDLATGTWRALKPRTHIPGSVWLPDVGKGDVTPAFDGYFKDNLARLTDGDMSRAIVVYCQADCWMSWNAVKRAASYGYTALYWFPEGSDGWRDWDGHFVAATPVPMQPGAQPPKP